MPLAIEVQAGAGRTVNLPTLPTVTMDAEAAARAFVALLNMVNLPDVSWKETLGARVVVRARTAQLGPVFQAAGSSAQLRGAGVAFRMTEDRNGHRIVFRFHNTNLGAI